MGSSKSFIGSVEIESNMMNAESRSYSARRPTENYRRSAASKANRLNRRKKSSSFQIENQEKEVPTVAESAQTLGESNKINL